jgi:hypothetical protein
MIRSLELARSVANDRVPGNNRKASGGFAGNTSRADNIGPTVNNAIIISFELPFSDRFHEPLPEPSHHDACVI